ncbi:TetR/AcrR family transcriptional regulator [Thermoleophilia bacterium SCSIO 60948]|nr:TetR/AcrR family transcriptional regulator [Thermoleophilia bacterium SCSIO 60948]
MTPKVEAASQPGRMSAEARREQILDAASEVVATSGFSSTTIEAVARRAGITRPVVYSHFGDLGGLLDAVVERAGAKALDDIARVTPTGFTPDGAYDALLNALSAYLDVAAADPRTWALLLDPPAGAPPTLAERIRAGRASVVAQLAGAFGGERLGELGTAIDAELLARTLSASADEAVRLLIADPAAYDKERIMRFAAWILEPLAPKGRMSLR